MHPRRNVPGFFKANLICSKQIASSQSNLAIDSSLTRLNSRSPPLVPTSTAVPAAAAKQQNEKYNDEKRGGIHLVLPSNATYYAA